MDIWKGTHDVAWEHTQDELARAYLSDGLPLVAPTLSRVSDMLAHNGYAADEAFAMLPPSFEAATAQDIAICAVMAGCKPEYMPVLVAAVEALSDMSFNLVGIGTTTGSAAPLYIVNGPIADTIGLNSKGNALGSGHRANATIGRAMTHSPWQPLHVERGFKLAQNVVTAVGISGTVEVNDSDSQSALDMAQTFAQSMLIAGNSGGAGLLGGGEPLCLLPPEWVALFERDGLTKAQAKTAIWERAVLPVEKLPPRLREHRMAASSDPKSSVIRVADKAEDLMIVVAGGVGRKAAYAPTWGGTTRAVSREIKIRDRS